MGRRSLSPAISSPVAGLIAFAMLLALPGCRGAPVASAAPAAPEALRAQIVAATRGDHDIAAFYRAREGSPVWTTADGPTPAVRALITMLQGAAADGLDPARYGVAALRALASAPGSDPARIARLEV